MSEKGRKENKKFSRRNFLKSASYVIGGAATLGIGIMVLTGCDNNMNCRVSSKTASTDTKAKLDTQYFGECVCPDCDTSMPHHRGVPCRTVNCPRCGTLMVRGAI